MMFRSKVNKYYLMSKDELRSEAERWNIRNYSVKVGEDLRQSMIDALLKKDSANQNKLTFYLSIIAIIISLIALFK